MFLILPLPIVLIKLVIGWSVVLSIDGSVSFTGSVLLFVKLFMCMMNVLLVCGVISVILTSWCVLILLGISR